MVIQPDGGVAERGGGSKIPNEGVQLVTQRSGRVTRGEETKDNGQGTSDGESGRVMMREEKKDNNSQGSSDDDSSRVMMS